MIEYFQAMILGILEGLTEFLPVSSTGHLLLLEHFIGFHPTGKVFEVVIQFGSILALMSFYIQKLLTIARALPTSPQARRFVIGVLLAFLPAALLGVLLHGFIKDVLFNPYVVCFTLIGGGLILLVIDGHNLEPKYTDATAFPLSMYVKIGIIQCLAMVPGVSRSGATIVGGLLLGADKRSAAEFSFFLAMPTMVGAFAYDLLKGFRDLSSNDTTLIVIGFVFAFLSGVVVVRGFLDYVSRHGFAPFAWWRIIVGSVGLSGLIAFG